MPPDTITNSLKHTSIDKDNTEKSTHKSKTELHNKTMHIAMVTTQLKSCSSTYLMPIGPQKLTN